jgi:hypothetical protein
MMAQFSAGRVSYRKCPEKLERSQNLQCMMADFSEVTVEPMLPAKKWQHCRTAHRQVIERHFQAHIVWGVVQASREDVSGVLFAVGGNVNFRQIQVELRVAAIHSHRGVAEFFRLGPFLLRSRNRNTHVGNIKRIGGILIESGAQARQRFVSVAAAQKCEAGSEFLERLKVNHEGTLRKDAGPARLSRGAGKSCRGKLSKTLEARLETGSRKNH